MPPARSLANPIRVGDGKSARHDGIGAFDWPGTAPADDPRSLKRLQTRLFQLRPAPPPELLSAASRGIDVLSAAFHPSLFMLDRFPQESIPLRARIAGSSL